MRCPLEQGLEELAEKFNQRDLHGGDDEHRLVLLLHPAQKRAEDPGRGAAVVGAAGLAAREALLRAWPCRILALIALKIQDIPGDRDIRGKNAPKDQ